MAVALIGAAAALAGAGVQAYSANSASKANKSSLAAEEKRIKELGREIDAARVAAGELREDRPVVSEEFGRILTQYPGLLARILPALENLSITSADRMTGANVANFMKSRESIQPGTGQLSQDVLGQIQAMNPDNMGQHEIAAITRMLSPLIPAGTLQPGTGAVRGATTSPVSLYRNLISGEYQGRRNDFVSAGGSFLGQVSNNAARQQVNAGDFLLNHVNTGVSSSLGLAEANAAQHQADIDAQEAFIRLAASGMAPQYDPSANNAIVAAGTKGAADSLAAAASAIAGRGGNKKTQLQ